MRYGHILVLVVNPRIFKHLRRDQIKSARSASLSLWQADCDLTSVDMTIAHINGGSLSRRKHTGYLIHCLGFSGLLPCEWFPQATALFHFIGHQVLVEFNRLPMEVAYNLVTQAS